MHRADGGIVIYRCVTIPQLRYAQQPPLHKGALRGYHPYTHVLVNDPTTGYGIFIENMLDAAA